MNPCIAKSVILVASVVMVVIRAPHGCRSRGVKVARSCKGLREVALLTLAWMGFLVPLIRIVSPLFSFAEDRFVPGRSAPESCASPGASVAPPFTLGPGQWNCLVTLELRENHRLITQGVYRHVRHPMDAALFLYSIGQALMLPNWVVGPSYLVAFGILFALRIGAEERMTLEASATNTRRTSQGQSCSYLESGDQACRLPRPAPPLVRDGKVTTVGTGLPEGHSVAMVGPFSTACCSANWSHVDWYTTRSGPGCNRSSTDFRSGSREAHPLR